MSRSDDDPFTDYETESGVFPADLLAHDRWFVWKLEDGRKIPRAPWANPDRVDTWVSWKDEDVWTDFTTADEWVEKGQGYGHASCIPAYESNETPRLVLFDFDYCRDPETGAIHPHAWAFIDGNDLHAAISTSGTGVHGYGWSHIPEGFKVSFTHELDEWEGSDETPEMEVYGADRFIALTGEHIEGTPVGVPDVSDTVPEMYQRFGSERVTGTKRVPEIDREELDDLETTTDVEVIYDAIALVRPGDIRLMSTVTKERGDGTLSMDPSWEHSESGTRLAQLDDCWLYRKGNHRLDALQVVALEERIIMDPGEYPSGEDFVDAVSALRERGARIPKLEERGSRRERVNTPSAREEAATDGGATASDTGGSGSPSGHSLDPAYTATWAGLGKDEDVSDLNDREKAATVWELLKLTDDFDVRVRRDNGSFWAYDDGVWKPEGERALRYAGRQGLGAMDYGANVLSELKAQASADPLVEVEADDFGLEPGRLAVENGLLDLKAAVGREDGAVRDLEPEDYALTRLPVEYDPEAEYDEWHDLVEEWAERERAEALQEYVGYCLHVGAMPIHRALLLVGSGANGKGTFLSVVRTLLGRENTSSIELQTLANERDAVADFYGSLANIDDDLSARKLGSGLGMFKKLVAGDRVRGRRLYEDGFEFDATGKHLYAANEVPQVDVPDDDEAFWRRWLLVEFPNHYPPSERDPTLRDRLVEPESLSGVLNWAIDGWARLMEQGHFTNEERYAQEKRERWQAWGESADKFISECLERDEDAERITTGDAHRRYSAWCRENNQDIVGQQELTNKLKKEDFGYAQSVRIDGKVQRGFKALGFSDEVPQLSDTPERRSPDESKQQRF